MGGLNVGSLFTGIGGIDLGLERAGHQIVFQCESDPYRRRVLRRHWPDTPCFGDVRSVGVSVSEYRQPRERRPKRPDVSVVALPDGRSTGEYGPPCIDLICGGFPCQDLSVAGRRAGLAGDRSGLFFEFVRVADALLPDGGWVLIENVPGLLSSNNGRDFAVLLASLAECGFHDLAWRVLDSRYLGVPQRRRRVFILARRSRGRRASEVLLEPEGGGGDFAAGREAREAAAGAVEDGVAGSLGKRSARSHTELDGHGAYVTGAVTAKWRKGTGGPSGDEAQNLIAHTLRAEGFDASEDGTGRGTPLISTPPHPDRNGATPIFSRRMDRSAYDPKPDGPRYAACGDAVTVNVAEWIGRRLTMCEELRQAA